MKAKNQFLFLILLILCLLGILLYYTFQDDKWFLFIAELYLVLLGVYAFRVRDNIFKPLKLLQEGVDALKDGDYNVKFKPTSSPDMNQLVGVYNQMIDKVREERTYQQEQHYFLDKLIEAMPIGVIILDFDHKISEFNPKAKELFGLHVEDIGKELKDIGHDLGALIQTLEIGESQLFKLDGARFYRSTANRFMYKSFPRIFVLVEDLSNELLHTEKQAYGKVIRMMAHEVNNSMGAINSILNSILSNDPINQEIAKEYLPIILERNEGLSEFMKNFAKVIRLPKPDLQPVDLIQIVRQCFQIIRVQYQNLPIHFSDQLPTREWMIHADKSQLEQAFMNILKNSVEAIIGEGSITVSGDQKQNLLSFIDSGEGIDEEIEEKLFTPFYSTKPTGQGVGLTLIKEILVNHRFPFSLKSEDGLTTFKIEIIE